MILICKSDNVINDADYKITRREYTGERDKNGNRKYKITWKCPFYVRWQNMVTRAYHKSYHREYPTYKGCTVCEEWLTFSNFRKWMITQDWEGKHFDKDIIVEGNKLYSPENCVFVRQNINQFIIRSDNARGKYLLGCHYDKASGLFIAQCQNPFCYEGDTRTRRLGLFNTELGAHLAWKKQKHEYACELANSKYVSDERVKEVLLSKYSNYSVLEYHIN